MRRAMRRAKGGAKGSISLFMSIVFLVLISFSLGLVEAYRVQYLYAKQRDIGRLAIQNLKSEYVTNLFEEYGILIFSESLSRSLPYLNLCYEKAYADAPEIKYFQDFFEAEKNAYHFPFFSESQVQVSKKKRNMTADSLMSMRREAILFAGDRLPIVMSQEWMEKLEIWKDAEISREWLEKKQKLLESLHRGEESLKELYRIFDGVSIHNKTQKVILTEGGLNGFCLRAGDLETKKNLLFGRADIPSGLKSGMMDNLYSAEDAIALIESYVSDSKAIVESHVSKEKKLITGIVGEWAEGNELSKIQKKFDTAWKKYSWNFGDFDKAIKILDGVIQSMDENIPKIEKFIQALEKANLTHSFQQKLKMEMQTLLQQYSEKEEAIGNLKKIRADLEREKPVMKVVKDELEAYRKEAKSLLQKYRKFSEKGQEMESEFAAWENKGKTLLTGQSAKFYYPLSYRGYREIILSEEETKDKAMSEDDMEEDMPEIKPVYPDTRNLPSDIRHAGNTRSMVVGASDIDTVMEKIKRKSEDFIVNEYYFMVFSHFVLPEEEEVSISGFSKKEHVRKGELEYLLFGDKEQSNQRKMMASLYGVRMMFNTISLLSDSQKMTCIQSLASAIAGWWSFGVGSFLMSALLVTAWSSVETGVDIFQLFQGKKVPILKTPDLWITSWEGFLRNSREEMKRGQNETKDLSITPSMYYWDYLRLFLLLGRVSEEMKWLRALDLIQQNQQQMTEKFYFMDAEREFEVISEVQYPPLFLPFQKEGYFGVRKNGNYFVQVRTKGGYE